MTPRFWEAHPDARYATLLRIIEAYCHPEVYDELIDDLKEAVGWPGHDPVFDVFKDELRRALEHPGELPEGALEESADHAEESDQAYLAALWHELYPGEVTPGDRPDLGDAARRDPRR